LETLNHFASTSHLHDTVTPWQTGCDKYWSDRKEGNIKFFQSYHLPLQQSPGQCKGANTHPPPDLGMAEDASALAHAALTCSHSSAPEQEVKFCLRQSYAADIKYLGGWLDLIQLFLSSGGECPNTFLHYFKLI